MISTVALHNLILVDSELKVSVTLRIPSKPKNTVFFIIVRGGKGGQKVLQNCVSGSGGISLGELPISYFWVNLNF